MTDLRKKFFIEREESEIRAMRPKQVFIARGLVRRILDLDPAEDALELRFPLLPVKFQGTNLSVSQSTRKAYKHGDYYALAQPLTQGEAIASTRSPLQIREESLEALKQLPEHQNYLLGYSFTPVQGKDRRKRVVPFVWIMEGTKLFTYSENITNQEQGIIVKPYADSIRVAREGAEIPIAVPSRRQKEPRYKLKLSHVPVVDRPEKNAVVWSIRSTYEDGREPEHSRFNIRYKYDSDVESSDVHFFYPQDVAGMLAVSKHFFYQRNGNKVPWDMNPFAKPSQKAADFNTKAGNNILVYDPKLKSKSKLRKPHVAERSILMARLIGVLGHGETMFWGRERDPDLKNYRWSVN